MDSENNAELELAEFEKLAEKYHTCAECGCPTDIVEYENEECVDEEDFINVQFHWKDCSQNKE